MQAIETTYFGPTNTRGSRVVAKCQAGKVSVSWDYALSVEENHDAAAKALASKLEWLGTWLRGARADDKGNVYVRMSRARNAEECRTPPPAVCDPLDYITVLPKTESTTAANK